MSATERGRERIRKVLNSSGLSIVCRLITMLTMFASTPLILGYLGEEMFGVWMTISSMYAISGVIDLGVGNSLLNIVARAHGSNDGEEAASAVSAASALLVVITFFCIAIFFLVQSSFDWAKIYNLNNLENTIEVGRASVILVVCLFIMLPFTVVQKVQFGFQEAVQAQIWIAFANLLVFALIFLAIYNRASLSWLVLVVAGSPALVMILCWINQFLHVRPWLRPRLAKVKLKSIVDLMSMSAVWTWFNLMAFIVMGLDNLIVAYFFGVEAVGGYAVMAKIHGVLIIAQLFSSPLWPAFAEAISRHDHEWVKRTFYRTLLAFTGIGFFAACVIGFGSFTLVRLWVGPEMVPTMSLALGFATWAFVCNFFAAFSALMANTQMLRTLTLLTTTAALSSVVLKFVLAKYVGIEGIVWASSIGYGTVSILALYITNKALNKQLENIIEE